MKSHYKLNPELAKGIARHMRERLIHKIGKDEILCHQKHEAIDVVVHHLSKLLGERVDKARKLSVARFSIKHPQETERLRRMVQEAFAMEAKILAEETDDSDSAEYDYYRQLLTEMRVELLHSCDWKLILAGAGLGTVAIVGGAIILYPRKEKKGKQ